MIPKKIDGRLTRKIQKELHIKAMVQFEHTGGKNVGAILLEDKGRLILRPGYETDGIHTDLTAEEGYAVVQQLRGLGRELMKGESLLIDRNNFPRFKDRWLELEERMAKNGASPTNALLYQEQKRLEDISTRHVNRLRSQSKFTLWTSITSKTGVEEIDAAGKLLKVFEDFAKNRSGEAKEEKRGHLKNFLLDAWPRYLRWHQVFKNNLSCMSNTRAMDASSIWDHIFDEHHRFSDWEVPKIPHLIRVNVETGEIIEETDEHKSNCKSALTGTPAAVPETEYKSLLLDGKHITVASLSQEPEDGWAEEIYQLLWLPDALARSTCSRVVAEFSLGNQDSMKEKLRNANKDSIRGANYAASKGESTAREDYKIANAYAAEIELMDGNVAIKCASSVFFHRDTLKEALEAANEYTGKFPTNVFKVEKVTVEETFFQSLPHTAGRLGLGTVDRRLDTNSTCFPSYLPLGATVSIAKKGFEMRAKYDRVPVYLDIEKFKGHILFYGKTRDASKTVGNATFIASAMSLGRYVTILDIPQNGQAASFPNFTRLNDGDYFDIFSGACYYNFFETPNIPADASAGLRSEIIKDNIDNIRQVLMAAVLGAELENPDYSTSAIDAMLTQLIGSFFEAREIQNRYRNAKKEGINSDAWKEMPTVKDFIKFCSIERLDMQGRSIDDNKNLGFIKSQLTAWFTSHNCKAPSLAQPSTFTTTNKLLTIALRNFGSNDEAAVFGLVAQGLAYRRGVQFMKAGSYIFNDENSIALKHKSLAQGLGGLFANSLKANIIVACAMQSPKTITDSHAGDLINSNTTYRILGKIAPGTEEAYAEHLGLPLSMVAKCATQEFAINKEGGYASYLFSQDGHNTYVEIEPQKLLLNMMKNNQDEREAIEALLNQCDSQAEVFRALQSA